MKTRSNLFADDVFMNELVLIASKTSKSAAFSLFKVNRIAIELILARAIVFDCFFSKYFLEFIQN